MVRREADWRRVSIEKIKPTDGTQRYGQLSQSLSALWPGAIVLVVVVVALVVADLIIAIAVFGIPIAVVIAVVTISVVVAAVAVAVEISDVAIAVAIAAACNQNERGENRRAESAPVESVSISPAGTGASD